MRPIALLNDAAHPGHDPGAGHAAGACHETDAPGAGGRCRPRCRWCSRLSSRSACRRCSGSTGAARQAAIVEASMPAAVVTTVLALEFDLDASLSTSVVTVSTLLSSVHAGAPDRVLCSPAAERRLRATAPRSAREGGIQRSRERHPREIRRQQPRRDPVAARESDDRGASRIHISDQIASAVRANGR